MEKREVTDVFLDESLLNDGDFLGVSERACDESLFSFPVLVRIS